MNLSYDEWDAMRSQVNYCSQCSRPFHRCFPLQHVCLDCQSFFPRDEEFTEYE